MIEFEHDFNREIVEVLFVPIFPGDRPDEVWFAIPLWPREDPAPRHELDRELHRRMVQGFAERGEDQPAFTLDTRYAYTSWGASGAELSVALTLGSVILGPVVAELWSEFREWLGNRSGQGQEMSAKNAEGYARWRVEASFGVDADDLALLAEEARPYEGSWMFRFDSPSGERFEVELQAADRGLLTGRIRRELDRSEGPGGG